MARGTYDEKCRRLGYKGLEDSLRRVLTTVKAALESLREGEKWEDAERKLRETRRILRRVGGCLPPARGGFPPRPTAQHSEKAFQEIEGHRRRSGMCDVSETIHDIAAKYGVGFETMRKTYYKQRKLHGIRFIR